MAMKNTLALASIILLGSGLQLATAQTAVYKSVDEEGIVTFTDRPLLNVPVEEVTGLSTSVTDKTAVDAAAEKSADDAKYQQTADDIRETQAGEDAEFQAAVSDQREAACRAANARLSKYKSARRLYRERPDGEREYLNDDELDAERAEAARAVDELCG